MKAGATWIREIPRRRQEAAQEREQHKAAVERAVAAEAADRERRRGNFGAEAHYREVEFGRLKVNEKNSKGWTPMHYAAAAGRKDIAEKLITLGAHLHDRNRNWSVPTPAEIAEDAGHHKMAGWLADGAVAEKEQRSKNMMEQSMAAFKERQKHQEKVITHDGPRLFAPSIRVVQGAAAERAGVGEGVEEGQFFRGVADRASGRGGATEAGTFTREGFGSVSGSLILEP